VSLSQRRAFRFYDSHQFPISGMISGGGGTIIAGCMPMKITNNTMNISVFSCLY